MFCHTNDSRVLIVSVDPLCSGESIVSASLPANQRDQKVVMLKNNRATKLRMMEEFAGCNESAGFKFQSAGLKFEFDKVII